MSYNSAYREDDRNTMSDVILQYTRTVANEIAATFLRGAPPVVEEPVVVIDPNLLFDVNFDNTLNVDYSKDGSALVFEANNSNNITVDDGFVTIKSHSTYLSLTTGLPQYLKHTGNQSWVVNFRSNTTSADKCIIQMARPNAGVEVSVQQRTGLAIALYNTSLNVTFFKGLSSVLVSVARNIPSIDLNLNVNSIVITYERIDHRLTLYLNGVFLGTVIANVAFVDNVIDWSTADNLYVNRFYIYGPPQAHYHKISAYDKVLTLEEVFDIYRASQPIAPYNPYEYTDMMYRNDAQNVSSYTVVNTNEVSFITDLSGGDVHNFNQQLGKDYVSGSNPAIYTNMTLETAINGHRCFDGFLAQGVRDTYRVEPGNVLKKNMDESYTWIHVARVNENLGQWDALLCYGKNLDSLTISMNAAQFRLFPAYASKQLNNASLFNANPILLNKNIVIIYRVLEKSSARLQIWDINSPSVPILDGTDTIPADPNLLFVNAPAMPFYVGCNNFITNGTTQNHTGHTHGETILYNSYLSDAETDDVKEFLLNKWGPA